MSFFFNLSYLDCISKLFPPCRFAGMHKGKEKKKNCSLKWEWGKIRILRTNDLVNCVDETKHSYNRDKERK